MNCKPNQLAWVVVPPDKARHGLEQLNNQVVHTRHLMARSDMPVWAIDPPLTVNVTAPTRDPYGTRCEAGETASIVALPDYWLRPFDPRSAPGPESLDTELPIHLELFP